MNCHDLRAILVEVLDGTLPAEARAHLDSCASCRAEAELHRRTWELAGKIGSIEPGANFGASVRRRVRRSGIAAWIGSCAAAAAVAAAIFITSLRPSTAPSDEDLALVRLDPEDRLLLEELANDRTWEIAENMELLRALEVLDREGANGEEGN